jgi:hypothetical protein
MSIVITPKARTNRTPEWGCGYSLVTTIPSGDGYKFTLHDSAPTNPVTGKVRAVRSMWHKGVEREDGILEITQTSSYQGRVTLAGITDNDEAYIFEVIG